MQEVRGPSFYLRGLAEEESHVADLVPVKTFVHVAARIHARECMECLVNLQATALVKLQEISSALYINQPNGEGGKHHGRQ